MTKYERHIRALCKQHSIKIYYVDRNFDCNIYHRKVSISRHIRSVKTYITALHEIGHVLNEGNCGYKNLWRDTWDAGRNKKIDFTSRYVLMKEIDAWRKAFELALKINQTATNHFIRAIATYLESYDSCHKKPMSIDYVCKRFKKKF